MKNLMLTLGVFAFMGTAIITTASAFTGSHYSAIVKCDDEKKHKCKKSKSCCKDKKTEQAKASCHSAPAKGSCCSTSKGAGCGSKASADNVKQSETAKPVKKETEKTE